MFQFNRDQYDFFDGIIAGDGCISKTKRLKNYKISTNFRYKEFAQYIVDELKLNVKVYKVIKPDIRTKKGYTIAYTFSSRHNILYTKERHRWYPNGIKIIPEDFRFSPVSMNILYLCDGTRASYGSCRKAIELCTQSFKKENLENTIVKYLNEINIECWVNNAGKVYVPARNVKLFLDYIGNCPVKCYKHKWDVGRLSEKYRQLNYDQLYELYVLKNLSSRKVGKILGCSKRKVLKYLKIYNIETKSR